MYINNLLNGINICIKERDSIKNNGYNKTSYTYFVIAF